VQRPKEKEAVGEINILGGKQIYKQKNGP